MSSGITADALDALAELADAVQAVAEAGVRQPDILTLIDRVLDDAEAFDSRPLNWCRERCGDAIKAHDYYRDTAPRGARVVYRDGGWLWCVYGAGSAGRTFARGVESTCEQAKARATLALRNKHDYH